MTIEEIDARINEIMKKYKLTMYGTMVCVVLYIVFLFFIKNSVLLIATCVPMILFAFANNKFAKQIKKLAAEKQQILEAQKKAETAQRTDSANEEDLQEGLAAVEEHDDSIAANISSLNDLPKDYTVLDDVDLDGDKIDHVIISPYGVAIVNDTDPSRQIQDVLEQLGLSGIGVYYYEPCDDVADLAIRIQRPKDAVLSEPDIYKILYKITGLK